MIAETQINGRFAGSGKMDMERRKSKHVHWTEEEKTFLANEIFKRLRSHGYDKIPPTGDRVTRVQYAHCIREAVNLLPKERRKELSSGRGTKFMISEGVEPMIETLFVSPPPDTGFDFREINKVLGHKETPEITGERTRWTPEEFLIIAAAAVTRLRAIGYRTMPPKSELVRQEIEKAMKENLPSARWRNLSVLNTLKGNFWGAYERAWLMPPSPASKEIEQPAPKEIGQPVPQKTDQPPPVQLELTPRKAGGPLTKLLQGILEPLAVFETEMVAMRSQINLLQAQLARMQQGGTAGTYNQTNTLASIGIVGFSRPDFQEMANRVAELSLPIFLSYHGDDVAAYNFPWVIINRASPLSLQEEYKRKTPDGQWSSVRGVGQAVLQLQLWFGDADNV